MAFDYKKEYKEFYLPENKPSIVTVPAMFISRYADRAIQTPKTASIRPPLVCSMESHLQSR